MQLDNKAFYADLFTKFDTPTPGPGRQLVPAATGTTGAAGTSWRPGPGVGVSDLVNRSA